MSETVVTVDPSRNNGPPKPAAPQQSQAGPLSWITFNTAYFQTVPGILKIIELVSILYFLFGAFINQITNPITTCVIKIYLLTIILIFNLVENKIF